MSATAPVRRCCRRHHRPQGRHTPRHPHRLYHPDGPPRGRPLRHRPRGRLGRHGPARPAHTLGVTLDMMILHGRAVVRGCQKAMPVIDMPFGTYGKAPSRPIATPPASWPKPAPLR